MKETFVILVDERNELMINLVLVAFLLLIFSRRFFNE
jgi:hypothetical protein